MFDANFLHSEYTVQILIVGLIVFIGLSIKELVLDRRNVLLRILATFLLIFSLVLLALKPTLLRPSDPSEVVLLTSGYDAAILDSIRSENPRIPVFDQSDAFYDKTGPNTTRIHDLFGLFEKEKTINKIYLLGEGLRSYESNALGNINVHYFPASLPTGIIAVAPPGNIIPGRKADINGTLRTNGETKLILAGPGGKIDSVEFVSAGEYNFSLMFEPMTVGRQVYHLESWSDEKLLTRDPIPVEIKKPDLLTVLLMHSAPSPELRFVKRYLAENNHKVMSREMISKDRYRFDYLNWNENRSRTINDRVLDQFDLVLIDQKTWRTQGQFRRNTMIAQMKMKGLGLLVHGIHDRSGLEIPPFDALQIETSDKLKFALRSEEKVEIGANNMHVIDDQSIIPLVLSEDNAIISACTKTGKGKAGVLLTDNTYELVLKGEIGLYEEIWTKLFEGIAGKNTVGAIRIMIEFPTKNEPVHVQHVSDTSSITRLYVDSIYLSGRQDAGFAEKWYGKFWTDRAGWHLVKMNTGVQKWMYIHEVEDWQNVRRNNAIQTNQRLFEESPNKTAVNVLHGYRPVNGIYFFLLALIGFGFLWLEPKF